VNIVTMMLKFNRQTLPFHAECLIAGARCLIATNSTDVLESTARWRTKTRQPHRAASFEMEVLVDSAMDNTAHNASFFRGHRHLVFAMLPPRSVVTYDLLRRRVHAVLSAAAARDRSFWNNVLLPITIGVLGTTVGVVPLHSACLDHNGSGVLVAGASGAGKSTLAAALAGCGFSFVSDDWTYISKNGSTLVAYGLSAPVKLLPDSVRFFPYLKDIAPRRTLNGELAYEIDPSRATGFSVNYMSYPRRVLFLERTLKPGCDFVPCRSEYVREFFEKSAERLPNELIEAKAFRRGIIQTLSSVPAWILRTGESPQRTAEAIRDFILEARDDATA
jgi:hypothetical protein